MDYMAEYRRWLNRAQDSEILAQLAAMDGRETEDAFYRDLSFGTGGLRGVIGAGTNRMNVYVVAKASQGLADYLGSGSSVVIGYDSRIKSDVFARRAAGVFAANGIKVWIWPELLPVPTVSFAVRELGASAGVMITASHNPSKYNGYKVYGPDGCQITTEAAAAILSHIRSVDIFDGVRSGSFEEGLDSGMIQFIDPSVLTSFIDSVKARSVLFGDPVDRDVSVVYTPLNGSGLVPVTRVLRESGFTNIRVVEEQRNPDGLFPTCPYPNPEVREAMELGLRDCARFGADLLIATDPDCDRCGIAVRAPSGDYRLLTGNETGLLLLDFICSQRASHGKMPADPLLVKTIVTTGLAEKIAASYGVRTVNVLTGFKFIGEVIGRLESAGEASRYIFGFEESYGYLTGTGVRDKDGVDAAFMICEMFAYYKTKGTDLLTRLGELYNAFGYCLNTLHSFAFEGSSGMKKMEQIMASFRRGTSAIGGRKITRMEDYLPGLNGLPSSDVLRFFFEDEHAEGSVVIRPSGTEPKLKVYISVTANDAETAGSVESGISSALAEMFDQL